MGEPENAKTDADPIDLRTLLEQVRAFVVDLPPAQREAFELADLGGMRAIEAAALSGRNVATVRSDLWRARLRVRERLLEEHSGFVAELTE